jgi:hypothetical protein
MTRGADDRSKDDRSRDDRSNIEVETTGGLRMGHEVVDPCGCFTAGELPGLHLIARFIAVGFDK